MAILNLARTDSPGEHPFGLRTTVIEQSPTLSGVARREAAQHDAAFMALLNAYRPTGGLLRRDDLAGLMVSRCSGDHTSLSRSIAAGEILCFDWNRTVWVPVFQLDRATLRVGVATRRLLAELSGAFDGWSAAHWFVASNAWLGECTPLELLGTHLDAVVDAASADCFIARG
jgi:hypothetical protein